ncbi:MAG TPA: lytic transglycosylase domain-containing protein [Candidatus Acidoferrales bacterium]|nr:lytic transglycosylase domain-containing protein [Candidatus Acidoferrales bacterium]
MKLNGKRFSRAVTTAVRSVLARSVFPAICALTFAAVLILAPLTHADYAVLRSGQRLHIAGYLRQGSTVILYVAGGSILVPSSEIVRFDPEDVFAAFPPTAALDVPFAKQIRAAAVRNGVDENLISSVIFAESNFAPRALSSKRAMGLMQLMPQTASRYAVNNAFDPTQNIAGGTRYLKQLLDQYHGNLPLALAAYNAGPERVAQYGGVPPFPETRNYIRRVTKKLKNLKAEQPRARLR